MKRADVLLKRGVWERVKDGAGGHASLVVMVSRRLLAVIGGRRQSFTPENERRKCINSYI